MTPDGRITSEFDDVADLGPRDDAAADRWDAAEWDAFDDAADDAPQGDDRDDDDLADLELVVIDLTGTAVADGDLVRRAFERAATAAGIGATPGDREEAFAFVRETLGPPTIGVFRTLTGDDDQAEHANAVFESAYLELVTEAPPRAVPGAEELIRRLRETGVSVALVTGLSRRILDAVLGALGWEDLADVTLAPGEAGRGRPFPDLALTALLRTGASSVEGMVVVGGTAGDIASGIAAGAGLVVGVLTGAHDEQTLLDAGADAVLPSIADLPELLGYDVARPSAGAGGPGAR